MTEWSNEVGRKLRADELKREQVVVLHKAGRPFVTMWVTWIRPDVVMFYAGVPNITLIAARREDGTVEDASGLEIEIFEYLGEV